MCGLMSHRLTSHRCSGITVLGAQGRTHTKLGNPLRLPCVVTASGLVILVAPLVASLPHCMPLISGVEGSPHGPRRLHHEPAPDARAAQDAHAATR